MRDHISIVRFLKALAALAILASIVIATRAYSAETGVVTSSNGVNFRVKPNGAKVRTKPTLKNGETFTVISSHGKWTKIRAGGKIGYVYSKAIDTSTEAGTCTNCTDQQTEAQQKKLKANAEDIKNWTRENPPKGTLIGSISKWLRKPNPVPKARNGKKARPIPVYVGPKLQGKVHYDINTKTGKLSIVNNGKVVKICQIAWGKDRLTHKILGNKLSGTIQYKQEYRYSEKNKWWLSGVVNLFGPIHLHWRNSMGATSHGCIGLRDNDIAYVFANAKPGQTWKVH